VSSDIEAVTNRKAGHPASSVYVTTVGTTSIGLPNGTMDESRGWFMKG
jgi:hypothetical protein